jgi:hypothetical protein
MFSPDELNRISNTAVGFMAGLQAQQQGYADLLTWEPFIRGARARWAHLSYLRVIKPIPALNANPSTWATMGEAVLAYLYGLPSSSVFSTGRTLEITLKSAYLAAEEKKWTGNLGGLIEWFEGRHPGTKVLADSCRMLRNTIHNDEALTDAAAVEKIRHCSIVLNAAVPFLADPYLGRQACPSCSGDALGQHPVGELFYGNSVAFTCTACQSRFNLVLTPS